MFGRDGCHVEFEICSLPRFIEIPFACFQFGVGSILKNTLTEQPAGCAGTEEDVASKILNLRTFERVEVKAV
ncbi:MAG: hypothetical protein ACYCOR_05985 [Acidobacteriaceae bacterium]